MSALTDIRFVLQTALMRWLLQVLALMLGLTFLATEPAIAAERHQDQKAASGSIALIGTLGPENGPLNAECVAEKSILSPYDDSLSSSLTVLPISTTTGVISQSGKELSDQSEFPSFSPLTETDRCPEKKLKSVAAKGLTHWGNPKTLADHFARHGKDFGAKSADDYARQASNFFRHSQANRLPTKIDADGRKLLVPC